MNKKRRFVNLVRRLLLLIGRRILNLIDWFYPPFSRFVSPTFFRYGICGVSVMMLDWVLYFLIYNFVIAKRLVHFGIVTLSPHVATLFITFPIALFLGFLLQKYVTFSASVVKGRQQLVRYMMVAFFNLFINYVGLKLLVDVLSVYPTPSKMIVTAATTIISYLSQKYFTFKIRNEKT